MRESFKGDPKDEGRMRISDNGPRNVKRNEPSVDTGLG
jgi:hypothetical protein